MRGSARDSIDDVRLSSAEVLWLAFFCLLWTFVVPGSVAACIPSYAGCNATFYAHQVRNIAEQNETANEKNHPKLEGNYPIREFFASVEAIERRREQIERLDRLLLAPKLEMVDPAKLQALLAVRRYYEQENTAYPPQITFLGFLESKISYVYFAAYLGLGIQLLLKRSRLRLEEWGYWACLVVLLYATWMSWNFLRNLVETQWGRTVLSFVHLDHSGVGFWLQEARALGLCGLIAYLWLAWKKSREKVEEVVQTWNTRPADFDSVAPAPEHREREPDTGVLRKHLGELHSHALYVGKRFDEWQIHSLLLAAAFFPWTLYFWSIGPLGDARYYGSTLIAHMIWGLTWWCISSPTLLSARRFGYHRSALRAELAGQSEMGEAIAYVHEATPISALRLVVSGVASVAAFFVPLLGLLK